MKDLKDFMSVYLHMRRVHKLTRRQSLRIALQACWL